MANETASPMYVSEVERCTGAHSAFQDGVVDIRKHVKRDEGTTGMRDSRVQ